MQDKPEIDFDTTGFESYIVEVPIRAISTTVFAFCELTKQAVPEEATGYEEGYLVECEGTISFSTKEEFERAARRVAPAAAPPPADSAEAAGAASGER